MKESDTILSCKSIIPSDVFKETNFDWLSAAVQKMLIDAFMAKRILDDRIDETTDPERKVENLCKKIHDIAKTMSYKGFVKSFIKTFKFMVKNWKTETIKHYPGGIYDHIVFGLWWWSFQLKISEDLIWNTNAYLLIDPYSLYDVQEKIDTLEDIVAILQKMKK